MWIGDALMYLLVGGAMLSVAVTAVLVAVDGWRGVEPGGEVADLGDVLAGRVDVSEVDPW